MKPINKKERSKAFYRIVGLFIISFAIAMVLGFTTMNISRLSDSKSNKDFNNLKTHLKFQEEVFAPSIDEITVLIGQVQEYKDGEGNTDIINADIASKLSSTKNQVIEDESWESKLYINVIKVYSNLYGALKEQASIQEQLANCLNSSSGSGDQVTRLTADNTRLQGEIEKLKAGGGGGGSSQEVTEMEKKLKNAEQLLRDCQTETKALLSQIDKLKK